MAAVLRPARSVGGDLYDVVAEGGRVWLLVGDVTVFGLRVLGPEGRLS